MLAASVDQLFTSQSLFTLQGSALAAFLVPNVLGKVLKLAGRLRAGISLAISLVLQIVVASSTDGKNGTTWIVAVLNGFLVAASALGVNQAAKGGDDVGGGGDGSQGFRTSWLVG
jgi:uncharacterized membrane protein YgcG